MLRSLAFVCFFTSGCTALVLNDDNAPAPCHGAGDCEAGFACTKSVCTRVADADSPPLPGVHVGVDGGDVEGPGISLLFDANAVNEDVQVDVHEASPTNVAVGVSTRSAFFAIAPEELLANRVVITIDAPGCDGGCRVFKRPSDAGSAWPALDAGTGGDGKAAGVLQSNDQLAGVYVAGVVTP